MKLRLAFVCLVSVWAATVAGPAADAVAAPKSLAQFCRANPNLDFPSRAEPRNSLPADVAKVGATNWRCMDGKVYVCAGGTAGAACQKMNPSRTPSGDIRETCEDNPGQDFVAIAVIGNSASTWRCEGRTAKIIKTVPLDARGFMTDTWAPLFGADGTIDKDAKLNADPR